MCSQGHQTLKEIGSPQTRQCINAYRKNSREKKRVANNKQNNQQHNEQKDRKNKKPKRLFNLDVTEFMVENKIKSEPELFAIADQQKNSGKKHLANFVLSRGTNTLSNLLENTCKMESADKKAFCSKETHIKVIHQHSHGRCADCCSEEWLNF